MKLLPRVGRTRRLAIAAAVLVSALSLGGCGLADTPAAETDDIHWVLGQTVPTLDIAKSAGAPIPLLALSHETLIRLTKNLEIEPVLAESWSEPTPTTLVYKLRKGVTFWDGTALTAEDVVFSISRHLDPAVGSPIASLLGVFERVEATAPDEVTITLAHPDPTAKYLVARATVTPKAYSEKLGEQLGVAGAEVQTMGTGPYRITRFDPNSGIEYEANEKYWGTAPAHKKVRIDFVPDANARQLAISSGSAQGTMEVPINAIDSWDALDGVDILTSPPLLSTFLTLNAGKAPFDDVHVRRAMAYAADREGFVKAFLAGRGEPASSLPTPAQWVNVADEKAADAAYASLPDYSFDVAAAKEELAKSAYPKGFSTSLTYPDSMPHIGKAMVSYAKTLSEIGITLDVKEAPSAEWRSGLLSHQNALNVMQLRPNYPDPSDYLNLLVRSSAAAPGQYNVAEYRSDAVDRLMDEQARASGDERVKALTAVMRQVSEDLPYIPLWWESSSMAVGSGLTYDGYTTLYYDQLWADNIKAKK